MLNDPVFHQQYEKIPNIEYVYVTYVMLPSGLKRDMSDILCKNNA